MVIRSGRTPAYWVVRPVSGTPWYRPSRPRGPGPCSTVTATLRIIEPSCSGNPSSATTTISSKRSGSTSITNPLSSAAGPAAAGSCNREAGASVITVTRLTEPAEPEGTVMDSTQRVARRALAAAALTSVAVLATACASSSTTTPSTNAAPAATPAAPATTPAAPSGPGPCPTTSLRVKLGVSQGTAGSVYTTIVFTNTSNATCTLYGYPGVSLTTGRSGTQIGKAAKENPATPRQLVTLHPQKSANALLRIVDAGNYPASTCGPKNSAYLQVYPPNQTMQVYIRYRTMGCAKPVTLMTVNAVRPGSGSGS